LDAKGACCASAVLTPEKECCESSKAVLDKSGKCCNSGVLDNCGVCDGTGVGLDWEGKCCNRPGALTASMQCCASGVIDGCGMCDGDDSLCGVAITLSAAADSPAVTEDGLKQAQFMEAVEADACSMLSLTGSCEQVTVNSVEAAPASSRRLQQESTTVIVHLELAPLSDEQRSAVVAAGGKPPGFSAAEIEATLQAAIASRSAGSTRKLADAPEVQVTIEGVEEVAKTFACGDGLCAPEERPVVDEQDTAMWCASDCPFPVGQCPTPSEGEAGSTGKV
jgi:hypothetical protein